MNMVIETSAGRAVIDTLSALDNGCTAWIHLYGETQFAKLYAGVFITEDGEAVEGEALEDVIVIGRVVSFLNGDSEYDSPVM